MKLLQTSVALLLGLVAFGTLNLLVGRLFGSARVDLTEDALYTLSDGAGEIARGLEEPVDLEFYFSSELGELNPGFRALAERVDEVLSEFERASDGKLRLERIDPEPYSEAEEQAVASGVRGIPISAAGDRGYFGLVGRNAFGDDEVLPFFNPSDPGTERFLEYRIGRMLVTLDQVERPKLALLSSLEVMGSMPTMPGQRPTPPWLAVRLLQQLFDVESLDPATFTAVPEDV
ncbi:MAG: GldG family protein, partial [Planctomycetota bacterium]